MQPKYIIQHRTINQMCCYPNDQAELHLNWSNSPWSKIKKYVKFYFRQLTKRWNWLNNDHRINNNGYAEKKRKSRINRANMSRENFFRTFPKNKRQCEYSKKKEINHWIHYVRYLTFIRSKKKNSTNIPTQKFFDDIFRCFQLKWAEIQKKKKNRPLLKWFDVINI